MIDLANADDFAAEDAPLYERAAAVEFSGRVLTLVLLTIGLGTDWYVHGLPFWRSLVLAIAMGVGLGLIVAILAYAANRATRRDPGARRLSRLLLADPILVPPAPPDATHRLLCGLLLPKRRFCGGMLHVCSGRLIFQPHFPRPRWWRSSSRAIPKALDIAPARTITLDEGHLELAHWWNRALGSQPTPLLACTWEGGFIALRVPKTSIVRTRLQACLDVIRTVPPPAA